MQIMQTAHKEFTTQEQLPMDIIKQLEVYRLENRITQVDLAKEIGVAFATVNRWLNGKVKPNKIQTYHIEKLLKHKTKRQK